MTRIDIYNEEFNGLTELKLGTYESCTFNNCHFSNSRLNSCNLIDCDIINSDLSNSEFAELSLRGVRFINSKLMGIDFSGCNAVSLVVAFEECNLQYASFVDVKASKLTFIDSNLSNVDFTSSNLSSFALKNCNLNGAIFHQTNLESTDCRGSYGFSINPCQNKLKKARFSKEHLLGLLREFDIDIE